MSKRSRRPASAVATREQWAMAALAVVPILAATVWFFTL